MKKKVIRVISVVGMVLILFGTSAAERNVSEVYRNYHIYDIYGACGVNLAKQAICDYIPGTVMPYYEVMDTNTWPEALVQYVEHALKNNRVDQAMNEIACDHITLNSQEKQNMRQTYPELERYYGSDIWYQVDLSQAGKDLVMCKRTWDGYNLSYIVSRERETGNYTCNPLFAGGQKKSKPYFVQWDEKNYVAYPYRDENDKEIVAMTIYDMASDADKIKEISIGVGYYTSFCIDAQEIKIVPSGDVRWPSNNSKGYIPIIDAYTRLWEE